MSAFLGHLSETCFAACQVQASLCKHVHYYNQTHTRHCGVAHAVFNIIIQMRICALSCQM